MQVNQVKSIYESDVEVSKVPDFQTFLSPMISNPPVVADKFTMGAFNFSAIPTFDGVPREAFREPLNKEFTHTPVLVLDYDGKEPLEAVEGRLNGNSYHLYTTFRHTKDIPRFRVVIPLKSPLKRERMNALSIEHSLVRDKVFGQVDQHSFLLSQYFIMPCKNLSMPDQYYSKISHGLPFEFSEGDLYKLDFEVARKKTLELQKEKFQRPDPGERYREVALKNIQQRIRDAEINVRDKGRGTNEKIYWLFAQLSEVLGSDTQAREYLLQFASHKKTISAIKCCKTK